MQFFNRNLWEWNLKFILEIISIVLGRFHIHTLVIDWFYCRKKSFILYRLNFDLAIQHSISQFSAVTNTQFWIWKTKQRKQKHKVKWKLKILSDFTMKLQTNEQKKWSTPKLTSFLLRFCQLWKHDGWVIEIFWQLIKTSVKLRLFSRKWLRKLSIDPKNAHYISLFHLIMIYLHNISFCSIRQGRKK